MTIPAEIKRLDENDRLAELRDQFLLEEGLIYLDGNSLGPLTLNARNQTQETLTKQWQKDLITSWNKHDWINMSQTVGEQIAPLIGAAKGQVVCCDSTSINLFKTLSSALLINTNRTEVLTTADNFPTDLYMVEGLQSLVGEHKCKLVTCDVSAIDTHLNENTAVLMLTHVDFRSCAMLDMQKLTAQAQAVGALVIWDLSHSVGAVPVELDNCEVDFAVGCGYKYLNGGPGAPAFIYAAARHHDSISQPLSGWMGHTAPFKFQPNYEPAKGIQQFLCGTPNVLSMAALNGALSVFDGISINDIRAKSLALSSLFIQQIQQDPAFNEFSIITPLDQAQRGSHVALTHPYAYQISQALIKEKVIVDFREPNIVRFGITPLYLRFQDIWECCQRLRNIMLESRYELPEFKRRLPVT